MRMIFLALYSFEEPPHSLAHGPPSSVINVGSIKQNPSHAATSLVPFSAFSLLLRPLVITSSPRG